MSNPRTIIFTQLLSYPAAYTNTILKNAAVKLIRDPKGNAPRTLAAALIMTEMARVGNYWRSHGESEKNKTPTEARLAAIARWGGYTLVLDIMERSRKSAEIYQSNVAYIAGISPVTSDIFKLAKSGDVVSFLGSKMPGYAAFKTLGGEDFKNDYDTLTKELNKKLTKFLVPEKEKKISFATGGEVNIPNAPKEPDQRIDKMTGLPYDVQAGDAFIDNEDPLRRLGFKGGGFVTDPLKRLGFGAGGKVTKFLNESVQEIISNYSKKEIDPLTAEKAADDILEPFRGYEDMPGELDDPEFEDFIKATVKAQLEEKHDMSQETMRAKYPQFYDEKGVLKGGEEFSKARGYTPAEIKTFEIASELEAEFNAQDATAHINDVLNSVGAIDISVPKDTSKALKDFYVQKEIAEDYKTPIEKIEQKYQKEIKNLSPEEIEILQKLKQELPPVPERPVKQRKVDIEGRNKALKTFLSTSKYKKPVYRATHSGFDTDYEISFAMPREIGTHVGARGQASSIAIRAVQSPDSMMQKLTTEKEIAEQFALPQQQEKPLAITAGYINISKPLEILEDFGNWGAYNILNDKKALDVFVDKISKQAFDGEGVSKDSVKARLNGLKKELDVLIKTKQDKGEASFNYQVRDADLNIKFKNLLENFGFDSIKYKNKNEAVLKGEDPYSFILFNPTQFKSTYATRFDVGDPRQNFAEGGLLKKTIRKLNNV